MPTEVVLDASAAAKVWRTSETHSAALNRWFEETLEAGHRVIVPPVFAFEARNLAARSVASGPFKDAKHAVDAWVALSLTVNETATDPAEEIHLACATGLSTHDAAYLCLARAGRTLVTYDAKLAKAARKLLGPERVLSPS